MKKIVGVILNIIYGCIIGVANIIPGVSGGTMAVMLNIYDKLISSFTGLRKHFKESMKFLIPVVIGAGVGIVVFSKLIKFLISFYPLPTCLFFIGLILGSLPMVFRKSLETKFRPISLIPLIITLGGMTAMAFIHTEQGDASSAGMTLDVMNWFILFFASAVAAMGMIIPGVSGSMLMMIFGTYSTVLFAISSLTSQFFNSCMILLPVALGVIFGIVVGAKLIDLCLKHFPQMSYFAIIGLMLGSPLIIYLNFQAESPDTFVLNTMNLIISGAAFVIGLAIALIFGSKKLKEKIEKKKLNHSKLNEQKVSQKKTVN